MNIILINQKIEKQKACRSTIIITWYFYACKNSYGFRAIWSPIFFLLGKIKLCRFFLGPLFNNITYFFEIIEKLLKGLHLVKLYNLGQNPYGHRTIWSSFSGNFLLKRGSDLKKVHHNGSDEWMNGKSFFKLAENRAVNSLWIGRHRYLGT